MTTSKEFVAKIVAENTALFEASKMNVKAYFESNPDKEALIDHFVGRMVNERMNMVEIAQTIANLPADTDPVELQLLSKQAHDEAVHFRMVKEVIEHLKGEKIDVAEAIAAEAAKPTAKGAALLARLARHAATRAFRRRTPATLPLGRAALAMPRAMTLARFTQPPRRRTSFATLTPPQAKPHAFPTAFAAGPTWPSRPGPV